MILSSCHLDQAIQGIVQFDFRSLVSMRVSKIVRATCVSEGELIGDIVKQDDIVYFTKN